MKIFISIASYCDDMLFFTIKDCLEKATAPQQLVFAVVDQNEVSQKEALQELNLGKRLRYVFIDKLDTFGVSWARNIAFSLWDDEDYLLQIDSHTLFEEGWDTKLLLQYARLKEKSAKPIISTYPYGFTFDENNQPTYKKQSGKYALVLRPHPDTSLSEDNAVLRFRGEHVKSDEPVLGCHVAGGFIFASADFIQEVPYDPYLYFHGEEQSLAVRAFTRGWDIYHPNTIPLYHLYKKAEEEHLTHHWHKSTSTKRALDGTYLRARARERVKRLFYGDGLRGTPYGLGDVRSLEEFVALSGIDYINKK